MPRTRSILWSELKLGVVGLVALALVSVTIIAVGGQGGFFWQRYPLKVRFDAVQGLKAGAVVRLNGKEIGQVTSVDFAGVQLEVAMEVSKAVRPLITSRSTASVGSLSLLGEPIIDLTAAADGLPIGDWGYVPSGPGGGALGALEATAQHGLTQVDDLVGDMRRGRGTLGQLVTDDSLYRELHALTVSAATVSRSIEKGQGTLGALTMDRTVYESLRASLDSLQVVSTRLYNGQGTLGRLLHDQDIADSLTKTTASLADITTRLNRGEGTAGKLLTDNRVYDQVASVSARLDRLVAQLNAGEGTAGQLLHNTSLYDNSNAAVTEVKNLVADIRKDPKKYLHLSFSLF